jgi:hypothetical protein
MAPKKRTASKPPGAKQAKKAAPTEKLYIIQCQREVGVERRQVGEVAGRVYGHAAL